MFQPIAYDIEAVGLIPAAAIWWVPFFCVYALDRFGHDAQVAAHCAILQSHDNFSNNTGLYREFSLGSKYKFSRNFQGE